MRVKKLLSVILTLCMVSMSFFFVIQANAKTDDQAICIAASVDDSVQIAESLVEPTEEFSINNKEDFNAFMTTSKYWKDNYKVTLSCNVDMQGSKFEPIENFSGIFDGCGHTVSNFSIKSKNFEFAFIKTLNSSSKIKDLTFDNYTIEGNLKAKKTALLVLNNHGVISNINFTNGIIDNILDIRSTGFVLNNEQDGIIESCTTNMKCKANVKSGFVFENGGSISNCQVVTNTSKGDVGFVYKNTGKIVNSSTNLSINCDDEIVGGFVSENYGTIEGCNSRGKLIVSGKHVGGFCGKNSGNISSCKSEGLVESSSNFKTAAAGGFVGENSGIIKECSSTGKVIGQECAGGFCGDNNEKGEIISCSCSGDVESKLYFNENCCGGFVGRNSGMIVQKCQSTGKVQGEECVGGFCGENLGRIISCGSEGSSKAETKFNKNTCGGFVGKNKGVIESCNSNGRAVGEECVGGFCGENLGNIKSCNSKGSAIADVQSRIAKSGGFVGVNEKGIISNCTSNGNVTSISGSQKAKAGGFVGVNKATIEKSTSSDCYVKIYSGIFYKDDNCGSFVGNNYKNGYIDQCKAERCILKTGKGTSFGGFVGEAEDKSFIKNSECKAFVKTLFCYKQHKKAVIENCFVN